MQQLEIILLASIVATACVLPGVFLVLRRMALMSDAISHAILLGIVTAFFVVKELHSPWLIVAATLTGILTVTLTELLVHSGRLKKDAAIGLVFPVFFSIGVILISLYAGNLHLDVDAVLLGEIAFAPFNRLKISGVDLGPISTWVMSGILLVNAAFVTLFYKELKLITFDKALAASLGFSPALIHYGLMFLVSVTAVGAFDAVGSILVVALMITPPSAAYLLTERLNHMIGLSVVFGILSAILGYGLAYLLDASISGSMATCSGIIFLMALIFSPKQGLLMTYLLSKQQKITFSTTMLLVQLYRHENTPQEADENTVSNMSLHMGWSADKVKQIVGFGINQGYVSRYHDQLKLSQLGREVAMEAMRST